MTPTIGRIVIYRVPVSKQSTNNGTNTAPAIITRVWSSECVNLTVFFDANAPVAETSVTLDEGPTPQERTWGWPARL